MVSSLLPAFLLVEYSSPSSHLSFCLYLFRLSACLALATLALLLALEQTKQIVPGASELAAQLPCVLVCHFRPGLDLPSLGQVLHCHLFPRAFSSLSVYRAHCPPGTVSVPRDSVVFTARFWTCQVYSRHPVQNILSGS